MSLPIASPARAAAAAMPMVSAIVEDPAMADHASPDAQDDQ